MRALSSRRFGSALVLVAALAACAEARRLPADPGPPTRLAKLDKADREDLHAVSLEVLALETLDQLQLTPAQLDDLSRRAPTTAEEERARPEPKVSDQYRKTLTELRAALRANKEEDVDKLTAALDKLRHTEKPELDDEVDLTDEARKQAPQVLRRLSARQVAGFILDYADEFPDPREKLTAAFDEMRKLPGTEWQEARDQTADQVGWLVAGIEPEAEKAVRDKVSALLTRVHRLSAADFKAQRPKLDRDIEAIVGKVGPTDVLRHFMERSLAELLSNPRLAAAVKVRRKAAK